MRIISLLWNQWISKNYLEDVKGRIGLGGVNDERLIDLWD